MIKVARVTQVDYAGGRVKVVLPERDNAESNWLDLQAEEYNPPVVGELVRMAFDDEDFTTGMCLGRYYNTSAPPEPADANTYYKKIGDDVVCRYDKASRTLTISAKTIVFNGDLSIAGNVSVTGNLSVSGTVRASSVVEGG